MTFMHIELIQKAVHKTSYQMHYKYSGYTVLEII